MLPYHIVPGICLRLSRANQDLARFVAYLTRRSCDRGQHRTTSMEVTGSDSACASDPTYFLSCLQFSHIHRRAVLIHLYSENSWIWPT
jgi:hypothetical protein